MHTTHLHALISQHNRWLSVRQSTVAGNIANANTPGFKAMDTAPFSEVLDRTPLTMSVTSADHIRPRPAGVLAAEVRQAETWDVLHSGNTVSLEQELLKAGEIHRAFSLNAGLLKAFHRLLTASAKG